MHEMTLKLDLPAQCEMLWPIIRQTSVAQAKLEKKSPSNSGLKYRGDSRKPRDMQGGSVVVEVREVQTITLGTILFTSWITKFKFLNDDISFFLMPLSTIYTGHSVHYE